jgi:hypothetical protein
MVECPRTQPQLELFLVHADGTGDADNAIGGDLALSDPEVDRVDGDPVFFGYFANLEHLTVLLYL